VVTLEVAPTEVDCMSAATPPSWQPSRRDCLRDCAKLLSVAYIEAAGWGTRKWGWNELLALRGYCRRSIGSRAGVRCRCTCQRHTHSVHPLDLLHSPRHAGHRDVSKPVVQQLGAVLVRVGSGRDRLGMRVVRRRTVREVVVHHRTCLWYPQRGRVLHRGPAFPDTGRQTVDLRWRFRVGGAAGRQHGITAREASTGQSSVTPPSRINSTPRISATAAAPRAVNAGVLPRPFRRSRVRRISESADTAVAYYACPLIVCSAHAPLRRCAAHVSELKICDRGTESDSVIGTARWSCLKRCLRTIVSD
jgi:hypothetical protein